MYGLLEGLDGGISSGRERVEQGARFFVWEPLAGQARPVKRMSYHKIVKIWGVLLPVETCKVSP